MSDPNKLFDFFNTKMSDTEFNKLSKFIYEEYGIKMPPAKKTMLQSRLHKRLRDLNMTSFKAYIDHVFSANGQEEVIHMMDVVSTNKTDFFREPAHFDFLSQYALPSYIQSNRNKSLKVWSAGCSSGEEPYTLAIVFSEFTEKYPGFSYSIYATDISTRVLRTAINAVYKEDRVAQVPMSIKRKYMLRSKDRQNPTVRIVPKLRRQVNFQRLNLMDKSYNVYEDFDMVFCRNVLIYFDRDTQEQVINKLCTKLKPNGYFFLGHSESITNMRVPLKQIKPTIFQRL